MGVSPTLTARSFRCPLFSAYPSFYSASSLGRPSTLFPRSSSPQLSARQSLPACRHVESPMRIKFNWLPPRQRFSPVLYASRSGKAICLLFPKLFCIRYFHSTLHWHSFCPWPSLFSQGRISKKMLCRPDDAYLPFVWFSASVQSSMFVGRKPSGKTQLCS